MPCNARKLLASCARAESAQYYLLEREGKPSERGVIQTIMVFLCCVLEQCCVHFSFSWRGIVKHLG